MKKRHYYSICLNKECFGYGHIWAPSELLPPPPRGGDLSRCPVCEKPVTWYRRLTLEKRGFFIKNDFEEQDFDAEIEQLSLFQEEEE